METKEFKIQVPEGYEIDREKSTFEKIIFKKIENELPKSWEEVGNIKGWFTDNMCRIEYYSGGKSTDSRDKNLFPTEEEAKASIALAQLCQLRDRYNDGWKPNWTDNNEKFCIFFNNEKVYSGLSYYTRHILSFKTFEIREEFLKNFKDLIETAKPLL